MRPLIRFASALVLALIVWRVRGASGSRRLVAVPEIPPDSGADAVPPELIPTRLSPGARLIWVASAPSDDPTYHPVAIGTVGVPDGIELNRDLWVGDFGVPLGVGNADILTRLQSLSIEGGTYGNVALVEDGRYAIPADGGLVAPTTAAVVGNSIYLSYFEDSLLNRGHVAANDYNDYTYTDLPFITAQAREVTVGDDYIYWTSPNDNAIGRARIDGSNVEGEFVTLPAPDLQHGWEVHSLVVEQLTSVPFGIALGLHYIYFTWNCTYEDYHRNLVNTPACMGRMRLDGTDLEMTFIDPFSASIVGDAKGRSVGVLRYFGGYLYWADAARGSIAQARFDGSEIDWDFVSGLDRPSYLAVWPGPSAAVTVW